MRALFLAIVFSAPASMLAQAGIWNPVPHKTSEGLTFRDDLDFYLNHYSEKEIKKMRKQVRVWKMSWDKMLRQAVEDVRAYSEGNLNDGRVRPWSAVADRSLLPLWLGGLCFAMALAAHFNFLKTFVLGHPIAKLGDFFTTYSIAAVFIRVSFGSLPERLGPKRVLTVAAPARRGPVHPRALQRSLARGAGGGACWRRPRLRVPDLARAGHLPRAPDRARRRARPLHGDVRRWHPARWAAVGAIIEAAGYRTMFFSAAGLLLAGLAVLTVGDRGRTHPS